MAAIAQQLGTSRDKVCAAFFDPSSGVNGLALKKTSGMAPRVGADKVFVSSNSAGAAATPPAIDTSSVIDLSSATADQLSGPAKLLGVTPDQLLAAVRAAVSAMPAPPAPPSEDEIINRLAQNLGISPDKVRAAITQVEGPNHFYFAVPIPNFKQ